MLVDQKVEMRWHPMNKKYYIEKGYDFTKIGDIFLIDVNDLRETSKVKVIAVCDYCHEKYKTQYDNYVSSVKNGNGKCSCNNCHGKKMRENTLKTRAKQAFEKLREICDAHQYNLVTDESEFTTVDMPIKYICPKHGEQTQTLCNILGGHYCRLCSYEKRGNDKKISRDKLIETIENVEGNLLLNPDDYIDATVSNLKVKCACGNCFYVSYDNYNQGKTIRCSSCTGKESNGEYYIRNYLERNNICFDTQYRFNDCRDIRTLPFDFYIEDFNLAIEFDGEGHYYPIFSEESYLQTVKHDKIKTKFCKKNNINLLRIPYWDRDRVDEVLNEELKKYR